MRPLLNKTAKELSEAVDIYAVADPSHLGRAMAATKAIIEAIEREAPGAFYRTLTAETESTNSESIRKNG